MLSFQYLNLYIYVFVCEVTMACSVLKDFTIVTGTGLVVNNTDDVKH